MMLKNEVQLVGSIHLAGDAVNASRCHIAGFRIVVNLVATVCVKVFYNIYVTFMIIQRAYNHDMIGAEIEQLPAPLSVQDIESGLEFDTFLEVYEVLDPH